LRDKATELGEKTLQLLLGLMLGKEETETFQLMGRTYQIWGIRASNAVMIYPLDH